MYTSFEILYNQHTVRFTRLKSLRDANQDRTRMDTRWRRDDSTGSSTSCCGFLKHYFTDYARQNRPFSAPRSRNLATRPFHGLLFQRSSPQQSAPGSRPDRLATCLGSFHPDENLKRGKTARRTGDRPPGGHVPQPPPISDTKKGAQGAPLHHLIINGFHPAAATQRD